MDPDNPDNPGEGDAGSPFIYSPNVLDDDHEVNGLTCFMDQMRQCGPDCMAYSTFPAESSALSDQQEHCLLLGNAERVGKHLIIIAKIMSDEKARGRKESADKQRRDQAAPISPMGPGKVGPQ
jgi:hypothetical protein